VSLVVFAYLRLHTCVCCTWLHVLVCATRVSLRHVTHNVTSRHRSEEAKLEEYIKAIADTGAKV
jgi:hypothetical protein